MVATKKTTTRKTTTKKTEKEKMKAQSFFKYTLPDTSYILCLFTPFSADVLTNEMKNNWNKDGIFSTLIGVDKNDQVVESVEEISKIQHWVSFAVPAKYVMLVRGLSNE